MESTCSLQDASSIFSAIIASIAVIVSAIITIKVTKSQIASSRELLKEELANQSESSLLQARADVISRNRQEWINTLRNEIAEFIADTVIASSLLSKNVRNTLEALELMKKILLRLNKVRLLINPNEPDHRELAAAMQDVFTNLQNEEFDIASKNNRIVVLAQKVLKEEWERVKAFT